jgi:heme/copper-type cytochrome/quinol oxidase subunit 3
MNVVVQLWAWRGAFSREQYTYVTNAAWYWHFVDTVWIFVFISFYVLPRVW